MTGFSADKSAADDASAVPRLSVRLRPAIFSVGSRRDLRNSKGRPKVLYMLAKWEGSLVFNFVPLGSKTVDLAKLETAMINAIRPPINIKDYTADISPVVRAAF